MHAKSFTANYLACNLPTETGPWSELGAMPPPPTRQGRNSPSASHHAPLRTPAAGLRDAGRTFDGQQLRVEADERSPRYLPRQFLFHPVASCSPHSVAAFGIIEQRVDRSRECTFVIGRYVHRCVTGRNSSLDEIE